METIILTSDDPKIFLKNLNVYLEKLKEENSSPQKIDFIERYVTYFTQVKKKVYDKDPKIRGRAFFVCLCAGDNSYGRSRNNKETDLFFEVDYHEGCKENSVEKIIKGFTYTLYAS